MLLVILGLGGRFLREAGVPIFALIEKRFALPDLFHDHQRLADHVVQHLRLGILDAVHIGRLRIGARADAEEIATLQYLRKPADHDGELGWVLVRQDVCHRRKFDLAGLERRGGHDQFGVGDVFPDLRCMFGDHHRGEARLIAGYAILNTPFERLPRRAPGAHIGVKDEASFHRHESLSLSVYREMPF